MKKHIKRLLGVVLALSLMCVCVIAPASAITSSAFATRESIIAAIEGLSITKATTATNIESAVTSVDGSATVSWKVPFTKILPTDGAIIKLNGEAVDGGTVRGHQGSIKGIITVTSGGATFDVAVDFTLEPEYETIDCSSRLDVTISELSGYYSTSAELVVITRPSGNRYTPENCFRNNTTIKAVIISGGLSNISTSTFYGISSLQAVVFTDGITTIYSNAFYDSGIKYVDFGSKEATLRLRENAFAYCRNLKNLYIGGYNSLNIDEKNTFSGDSNMEQLTVDLDTITAINSGVLKTNYAATASITTVVCNNSTVASAFETAGAAATIDITTTPIVDYYSDVSALKVRNDATAANVISAAEALDTESAFTVSAEKTGNIFEVSITDGNDVTAVAYLDATATVQSLIDEYEYTASTTKADIITYVNSTVGTTYDVTWLEDYNVTEKVDGARVYARADSESEEYTLYGTVPGQDSVAHGSFVIKSGTTCSIIEIEKTIEAAAYEDYHLTGVCTSNVSSGTTSGSYNNAYDGTSQLVILTASTIYGNVLNATAINGKYGAGTATGIKAVIVNGNIDGGAYDCFRDLTELKVIIFKGSTMTELRHRAVYGCSSLKYVYLPDNILRARATTGDNSDGSNDAFNMCTALENILVPDGFVTSTLTTNSTTNPKTYAHAVTRYAEDETIRKFINFYNESTTLRAMDTEDLRHRLEDAANYDADFDYEIAEDGIGFIVTIEDLSIIDVEKLLTARLNSAYDVNTDSTISVHDLVRIKNKLIENTTESIYDINGYSGANSYDIVLLIQKILVM